MRSVTLTTDVEVDVDVDIDDYIDEFLEEASLEELTGELKKRGFKIMEKSNIIKPFEEQMQFSNPVEFKRHLCNITDVGYYISNEELLETIKIKLP